MNAKEIKRMTNRRSVDVVIEHGAGQIELVIVRTFPLAVAAAARRCPEEAGQFGTIVLEVP